MIATQMAVVKIKPPGYQGNPSGVPDNHSQMAVVVKTVLGSRFGVGEFTTHGRDFSGDWDVHKECPKVDLNPRFPFCGNRAPLGLSLWGYGGGGQNQRDPTLG